MRAGRVNNPCPVQCVFYALHVGWVLGGSASGCVGGGKGLQFLWV